MNHENFDDFVRDAQQKQLAILTQKSSEYSSKRDKFENIKRGARRLGITPAQMADAWRAKHEISLDLIMDGTVKATPELLAEKFTDDINYLYMQWFLLLEEAGE